MYLKRILTISILLVILSPWAANQLADNPESVTLFIIYGLCTGS